MGSDTHAPRPSYNRLRRQPRTGACRGGCRHAPLRTGSKAVAHLGNQSAAGCLHPLQACRGQGQGRARANSVPLAPSLLPNARYSVARDSLPTGGGRLARRAGVAKHRRRRDGRRGVWRRARHRCPSPFPVPAIHAVPVSQTVCLTRCVSQWGRRHPQLKHWRSGASVPPRSPPPAASGGALPPSATTSRPSPPLPAPPSGGSPACRTSSCARAASSCAIRSLSRPFSSRAPVRDCSSATAAAFFFTRDRPALARLRAARRRRISRGPSGGPSRSARGTAAADGRPAQAAPLSSSSISDSVAPALLAAPPLGAPNSSDSVSMLSTSPRRLLLPAPPRPSALPSAAAGVSARTSAAAAAQPLTTPSTPVPVRAAARASALTAESGDKGGGVSPAADAAPLPPAEMAAP